MSVMPAGKRKNGEKNFFIASSQPDNKNINIETRLVSLGFFDLLHQS